MSSSHPTAAGLILTAIQLLQGLGWRYLNPHQALALREGRTDHVILTTVLRSWLKTHIRFLAKGASHRFSNPNITEAIRRLSDEPYVGLRNTNERLYHLLTLGISLDQPVDGDSKGRALHFIDWRHPERNSYHMAEQFAVERHRRPNQTRQPDLVLFINGIPIVIIGYPPHPDDPSIEPAMDQLIRLQNDSEIPKLFQYAQLLLASSADEVRYGTVNTEKPFWSRWREEGDSRTRAQPSAPNSRRPIAQDETFRALLRPQRLLPLIRGYTVFDAGARKIARYHQYFAVTATLNTVSRWRNGQRAGGVVWHTAGSGKSLTMVMLAKALALQTDIHNPRVILVTDRIDLDKQLTDTFNACGKNVVRATTGKHLMDLITAGKASLITTVIHKFMTLTAKHGIQDDNPNIFVIVDESHRSHYGELATRMRRVFKNASYIGFTGTPLLKAEKNTARKFGGFIHRYAMRQALEDGAVVPLIYEGRLAITEQNQSAIQARFEQFTRKLTPQQTLHLKRLLHRRPTLHQASERIKAIALDISLHYRDNLQGTGLKAQLATDSRHSAVLYRSFIQDAALISCELIMSAPGLCDDRDDTDPVQCFWNEMMQRYGNEENYNDHILAAFSRDNGPELLIVVDKLLTGFDEPRNTALYIDKPLKDHNLLQAIARVNRLHRDKRFGCVIDYRGVLGNLNNTLNRYDALANFDADDVDLTGVLTDSRTTAADLAHAHQRLWALFGDIHHKQEPALLAHRFTTPQQRRQFHEALTRFQQLLAAALTTNYFHEHTSETRIDVYKHDIKQFRALQTHIQQRHATITNHTLYEKQLRNIIDRHIHSPEIRIITDAVDIFNSETFDREIQQREGEAAKADTIANRSIAAIHERVEEDPVFYQKFADLMQHTMDDYHQGRIDETRYLQRTQSYLHTLRRGHDATLPGRLRGHGDARAYYGIINQALYCHRDNATNEQPAPAYGGATPVKAHPLAADIALVIEDIIANHRVRDWQHSEDVIKKMENDIDDYFYGLRNASGLKLDTATVDDILERCIRIAVARADR